MTSDEHQSLDHDQPLLAGADDLALLQFALPGGRLTAAPGPRPTSDRDLSTTRPPSITCQYRPDRGRWKAGSESSCFKRTTPAASTWTMAASCSR